MQVCFRGNWLDAFFWDDLRPGPGSVVQSSCCMGLWEERWKMQHAQVCCCCCLFWIFNLQTVGCS
ncbi:uncharacterized protein EI90DRAFT_3096670 [Cantharellus anzutake]|uniref:uncharacterized protein n=1 Tax=Cantharellus anzutake TaxID=1750568 RepID=UPI00190577C4|nr:uncharacterized protein EI90DRAFT_3096670 [Cantharellus anzutake]KAF8311415.1 hypothetical protein EI90DRAFT_3096670 [Cantharellus anzutake]